MKLLNQILKRLTPRKRKYRASESNPLDLDNNGGYARITSKTGHKFKIKKA